MKKPKRLFIAATRQNDGKTFVSLGLVQALSRRVKKLGFIKPVGQRYVEVGGRKIDEDSVLIDKVCKLKCNLRDMSPVAIERNFTRTYIDSGGREEFERKVLSSFDKVAKDKDFVLIEGTGHAGVGSVFDMSNGFVAKLLGAKVLLISIGGIGRPIDEIMLNAALFEKEGVEVLGAVINKVRAEKLDDVRDYVGRSLKSKGIDFFGAIPYESFLNKPTVGQILEELGGELINGRALLNTHIREVVVGAMTPHQAINYFTDHSLVITPGDREDLILTALSSRILKKGKTPAISGLVLTGNISPADSVIGLIKNTSLPVITVKMNTYEAASRIDRLTVKIMPAEKKKIREAERFIEKYVNVDGILEKV